MMSLPVDCLQYTTRENRQYLASVTRGKFCEKCLAWSISHVPLEPNTINRAQNVPHEIKNFAKQKCLSRGFRGTPWGTRNFLSSFTCCVLCFRQVNIKCMELWQYVHMFQLYHTQCSTEHLNNFSSITSYLTLQIEKSLWSHITPL